VGSRSLAGGDLDRLGGCIPPAREGRSGGSGEPKKVEKRVIARARVEAREDQAVEKALKGAPEWAAEEVPPDVLKALRE